MTAQATAVIDFPTAAEQNPEEIEVIAAAQAAGEMIQDLPIAAVAPDPENPTGRLSPEADFVESIKLRQLSPGVVVRLNVWAEQGNDPLALYEARAQADGADPETDPARYAAAIAQAEQEIDYVIVFGHRRWAAAKAAGSTAYRAVVTEDIKDRTTKRIQRIMENVHRDDLSPLEEAHEYHRLIKEDGLGQRELTRRTGIPQSKISRRLGLLKLPKQAQDALTAKEIPIEVANALITFANEPKRVQRVLDVIAAMPQNTDEERDARIRAAKDAAQTEARAAEAAKAQTQKRAELKKRNIPVIADLAIYFETRPHHRYQYMITGEENIQQSIDNGTAIAWVANGGTVEWYTTEEHEEPPAQTTPETPAPTPTTQADTPAPAAADRHSDDPAPSDAPAPQVPAAPRESEHQRRAREEREREEHEMVSARMARDAACQRIASKVPNRDQLTARLSRRLLLGDDIDDFDAQKLTVEWLSTAGVIPAGSTVYAIFGDNDTIDPKIVSRAAYVYDLALDETRIRDSEVLDSADVRHIERLTKEAGYEPTTWEQTQIDTLTTID